MSGQKIIYDITISIGVKIRGGSQFVMARDGIKKTAVIINSF